MQYLMMVRWWLTISATFWLIRMMSMSSRRMKLLRVSWDGDNRMGGDTSSKPSAARLVTHLNVWDGSVLVHHHKVWPPGLDQSDHFLFLRLGRKREMLWHLFLSSSPMPPRRKPTQVSWIECKLILVFLRFSTSSPITPINFPLAELRAILICFFSEMRFSFDPCQNKRTAILL